MKITVRQYENADVKAMICIWNQICQGFFSHSRKAAFETGATFMIYPLH